MGNCPICEKTLPDNPLSMQFSSRTTSCAWCNDFGRHVIQEAKVIAEYSLHEPTPLHLHQKEFIDSFHTSISVKTPHKNSIAILGRKQSSAQALGSFFHGDAFGYIGAFRHDFSVLEKWNSAQVDVSLVIPPGIQWIQGIAAGTKPYRPDVRKNIISCEELYLGGQTQMFLPKNVVEALWKPSEEFLQRVYQLTNPKGNNMTTQGPKENIQQIYQDFLRQCKPALELQKQWNRDYTTWSRSLFAEAKEQNLVQKLLWRLQDARQTNWDPILVERLCQSIKKAARTSLTIARYIHELQNALMKIRTQLPKAYQTSTISDILQRAAETDWKEQTALLSTDAEKAHYLLEMGTIDVVEVLDRKLVDRLVVHELSFGNHFSHLPKEIQSFLKTKQTSIIEQQSSTTSIPTGEFVLHEFANNEVLMVIITFQGTKQEGNTTIYMYLLTICTRSK
jgi:hypothetical protein